jgi:carbamoyl-phosphate synthase small subunit
VDCGIKWNIIRSLARRAVRPIVVGHSASYEEIMALNPAGVVVSNGPGDPANLHAPIATLRRLIDSDLPVFGICLGHQLLGLAVGATTSRLKYGHHGANHPVKDLVTGVVSITSQNHEFQVDRDSIPADSGFLVSKTNLNDGSVEGLAHHDRPVFSVQYHPEGSPGPQDNQYLFDHFLKMVATTKSKAGTER